VQRTQRGPPLDPTVSQLKFIPTYHLYLEFIFIFCFPPTRPHKPPDCPEGRLSPPPQWRNSLQWARASSLSRLHDHTPQSVGLLWMSDQLDAEISTWQHTTHKRYISMPPAGFAPAIPPSKRPQTHALYRTVAGIGDLLDVIRPKFYPLFCYWKHNNQYPHWHNSVSYFRHYLFCYVTGNSPSARE
jgi:hypothetical protein